jgi:hypothetical protein
MGATQGKRRTLKGTKSASVQVGDIDKGRVAERWGCGICLGVLHKPLTLVRCLLSFCARCYSYWMRQRQMCPDCRAPCGKVGRSHTLHNVVAAFVEAHPEFLREQEEIERLDGKGRLSEVSTHCIYRSSPTKLCRSSSCVRVVLRASASPIARPP